jgi:4-hydroxythreonine-4-phosphate dehydrogenase
MNHMKPLLAFTQGDPAGVGPEIIAAAWTSPQLHELARLVVIGRPEILQRAVDLLHASVQVVEVTEPEAAKSSPAHLPCLSCGSPDAVNTPPAVIDPRGGQAAYDALILAAQLALAGRIDGLVTAPLNKAALWAAEHHYPGHTELLAELCGVPEVAMMLYLAPGPRIAGSLGLGVAHVTLHMALRDVFANITAEKIRSRIALADGVMRALQDAPSPAPRIGVCALNPHAGEQGLFGDEEQRIIAPAVEQARAAGFTVEGPLPADTLLARAAGGAFDAVVAMYHDQGHIALKLLEMHRAVNITLGLPIVRTSVAHGTAFDLAWQGRAEWSGLIEATRVAAKLARRKK